MNVHQLALYVRASFVEQIKRGSEVTVRAEIKPPGERDPQAWVTKAREHEPAAHLAFCISGELVNGFQWLSELSLR